MKKVVDNISVDKCNVDSLKQAAESVNIHSDVTGSLYESLSKKLEEHFIYGLKRKGFEFKHKSDLEAFVKERCRCEDNTYLNEKVYYVDNTPFFLHSYKIDSFKTPLTTCREHKLVLNLGKYTYL